MMARPFFVFALVLAQVGLSICLTPQTAFAKTVVTDETQLPRFAYKLSMPPSALVVADDASFAPFAAQVKADVDRTLADYDISDKATLSELLKTRVALKMLAHDFAGAQQTIAMQRQVQTKASLQLLTGREFLNYIAAQQAANGNGAAFAAAYRESDGKSVDSLPWSVVADSVKSNYSFDRIATADLLVGSFRNSLDPAFVKTGTIDGPTARSIIESRAIVLFTLPYMTADAQILKSYIARNATVKPDIWGAREVTIAPGQAKAPVVVGIWDSGIDPTVYSNAMYVDAMHRHGIAVADDATSSTSDLLPISSDVAQAYAHDVAYLVGMSDLQSGIDSPDAASTVALLKSLKPDQAKTFSHRLDVLHEYTHGSHVAGIAIRNNAAALLLNARFNDDFADLIHTVDPEKWVNAMAAQMEAQGAYFRANHVRVVNMSWGDSVSEFEDWLGKTEPNADPQARKAEAQKLYGIWRAAIADVIANSPDILFLAAAGNTDSDASFGGDVPASLNFPNLMTVGAVNQAGDPANFTSYGPTVAVYADGYQVPSKLPGGYVVRYSGTSMATPNVTNLAAKLFALDPSLTPVQVRALIIKGATLSEDGKRKLIDPKATVKLLA